MLTAERFDALLADWSPRFADRRLCAEAAREYVKTAIVPDETRFAAWMTNALAKDQLLHRADQVVSDPLAEAHPSTYEADSTTLASAIARGDLHDFRDLSLSLQEHTRICPRCQMGIHSREVVDRRAAAAGKRRFPHFAETVAQTSPASEADADAAHQAFVKFWREQLFPAAPTS